jgi:DNA-binding transcriptional LysR family regulator
LALDPRLLRSFVVLAEELHSGRAAERLNVAQPALSQQIHRLEQQVGTTQYTRNSRLVELTDSGRAMLDPARAALRAADQAERAEREASRTAAHPLTIGINLEIEDVVPVAVAYVSDHPEVRMWLARMYEPQGHEILGAGTLYAVAPFAISAAVGLIAKNLDP